jgi:hypothetical protein
MIGELVANVNDGNIDIKTLNKYFNAKHEIEVRLEFEWCENNNISEENCQKDLQKHIGDSSLTLLRIWKELELFSLSKLQQCKLMNDKKRTSGYLVDLGQRSYIVLIDKKYKAIFDIISQDTISLFMDSNDFKIQNSELIKRYLNEN